MCRRRRGMKNRRRLKRRKGEARKPRRRGGYGVVLIACVIAAFWVLCESAAALVDNVLRAARRFRID
jgi:hypothetical protein